MKYSGYVKFFDSLRGEGMIAVRKSPTGKDCSGSIFFHWSSLPGASRHSHVDVKEFAPVIFDIVDGYYGPTAHKIEYINDKSSLAVVEEILIGILDEPESSFSELFYKDWVLNNWLGSLRRTAKKNGHFINENESFWEISGQF